jgi:hypothetical protein
MLKNAFSYLQDSLLGNFSEVFLPRWPPIFERDSQFALLNYPFAAA